MSVPPPKRSGTIAKLALLLGSALASLLLVEVGLRLVWDNPFAGESPDRIVALPLQHANANLTISRGGIDSDRPEGRLRADARSYVEPARPHTDPDATIVFLGGSTTECSAVSEDRRFPARTGQILSEQGIATNALNAGHSGNTLHDALNILLNHVVLDQPDLAVLMHATNDIGVLARGHGYRGRSGQVVRPADLALWFAQMLSSRSSLMAVARNAARGGAPADDTDGFERMRARNSADRQRIDPKPFVARLRSFVHTARAFDIEPVLMTQPLSSSRNELTPEWADPGNQDVFNEQVRAVAAEEGVLLIDLVRHVQAVPRWDEPGEIFYDGMHVNDEGSEVYARYIADRLKPRVSTLRSHRRRPSSPTAAAPIR